MMFVDLEASGLGEDSWPIEIGFAWIEGGRVRWASKLIRPEPGWPRSAWSSESAVVHGITMTELHRAEDAADVARWAAAVMGNRVVVSDAPSYDGVWLDRLLAAAGLVERPPLRDFDVLVSRRHRWPELERVYAELDATPPPHRAGPDAARLAAAWRAGIG